MAQKIKWGIVGLGLQATRIATAINSSRNGTLAAVVSKEAERAEAFARSFQAHASFSSMADMLHQPDIEAVFIASETHHHTTQTLLACKAGKHVLCEKPFALRAKDGEAMIAIAKIGKVYLGVGFHLRFHPAILRLRDIIQQSVLGTVTLIEADWSVGKTGEVTLSALPKHMQWRENPKKSGGGALMARGVHLFDLVRFLTGSEISEVAGITDTKTAGVVDTLAIGMLRLKNATIVNITTSRRIPCARNEIIVYGTNGRVRLSGALQPNEKATLELLLGEKRSLETFESEDLYRKEIEQFGDLLRDGLTGNVATGEDGLASVRITEAFLKSAKTGVSLSLK